MTLKIIRRKWVLKPGEKELDRDTWKLILKEARVSTWTVQPMERESGKDWEAWRGGVSNQCAATH
jgi:hypothetical protein